MAPSKLTNVSRRTFLAGVAASTVAAGTARTVAAAGKTSLDEWFQNTDNYDGVVDERGANEVRVKVGVQANGGPFGFGPAAVRVDPGTTVVWEWTGNGGVHNVTAGDGSFESDLQSAPGATFTHAFETAGVHTYACTPHEALGMKGAVVVGDAPVAAASSGGSGGEPDYGGWFDDVSNFAGTVDERGNDQVVVKVGATGNGGNFAFDPPAVHVDSGTTVVWEWTGNGGAHDVTDPETGFKSELTATKGHRFALTFDGDGISKYYCEPHRAMGMKGAIVVGSGGAGGLSVGPMAMALGGSVLAALLSPLLFGLYLYRSGEEDGRPDRPLADVERESPPAAAATPETDDPEPT